MTTPKKSAGRSNTTLHLSRAQYRLFAELAKSFGMGLTLSSPDDMGGWASYSPWALLICKDASVPQPEWDERALLTLASFVRTSEFRTAGANRPELDWAALNDSEIYDFLMWHEIGHRMDNFDVIGSWTIPDPSVLEKCGRQITFVNEILADRYAWSRVRPGEPLPRNENGVRNEQDIVLALEYLSAHTPRLSRFKLSFP